MKLDNFALVAAVLAKSVATVPSPDPGYLEVVLSLDNGNLADKPMIARTTTTTTATTTTAPIVQMLAFNERPTGIPEVKKLNVDGQDATFTSKSYRGVIHDLNP